MDSRQVPIQFLIPRLALLAAGLALLPGCGARRDKSEDAAERPLRRLRRAAEKELSGIKFAANKNSFRVSDRNGQRLLEAKVDRMEGGFQPGGAMNQPIRFKKAKCLLFQEGKPNMHLESPEAVWDGKQLVTDKTAHAVTADGATVMDAQKAVWTADTAHLQLETAKLTSLKKGKTEFVTDAPKALVVNHVATMPDGAVARNPRGQQLTADHMRWHLKTQKLEANGNVVVTEKGKRVSGDRLVSDTRLKRGRFSGNTEVRMRKLPGAARKKG